MTLLEAHVLGEQATEVVHIALMTLLTESVADLFNRVCFNYPTLGDLYKYATYDAILQRATAGLSATKLQEVSATQEPNSTE